MEMIEIRATGNYSRVTGYIQTWCWGEGEVEKFGARGIKVDDEDKAKYVDFVGKIQGVNLGNRGFYGVVAEEKMFDLFSYLFNGAVITIGKKKNLEGEVKISPNVPSSIVHIFANEKSKVEEIAKIFALPLK